MKNMTPVILGLLMLTSFFAGVDFHELEEPVVIEETGARSGADPSVMAITTPKETNCDTTGCRNALQVGEETTFSAYIKNSGDANIVEMGYTVTIYAADSSGNAGNIAVGADGSPLQWSNPDVMCDDITVCQYDGAADPLAPNAFLGGGKETLRLQGGGDITWTPTLGEYLVEVKVNSPEDADVANNAQLITVVVEDWNDIEVDLQWTVGNDPYVLDASGGGDGDFKLIVMANGSDTFTPREVQIRLHVTQNTAMVDSAQIGTTAFPLDGTGVLVTAGVQQTVEVFMNESDPNGSTLDARNVLDYQTAWEVSGVLVPGLDSNAQFEITAELESYTLYGPFEDCMETYTEDGEDEENTTIWMNSCEVVFTSDDRPKTDADEIFGTKITYDDIRISRMGVFQGYNSDCTGFGGTFTQEGEVSDLNVGCGLVYAEVMHRGSDPNKNYGWNISYTVQKDGAVVADGVINECVEGAGMSYMHEPLGNTGGASPTGAACVMLTMDPGVYTFELTLNMNDKNPQPEDTGTPWTGATDARPSNNDARMEANVINNLPVITSFELVSEGDIVADQGIPITFIATAFDVDDPSGEALTYEYRYQNGEMSCAEPGAVCEADVTGEYIGNLIVTVVVTDAYGGQASSEMALEVWNEIVATATTDAGISIEYPLQYFALSLFEISTFADGDASGYDAVQLDGFAGTYAAVAVVDYAPSTTFQANDILSQGFSIMVDKSIEATSLWYIDGSGKWILFSDMAEDVDATTEKFTYTIPANSPVIPSGTLVLMGGELAQAALPDASVSGFNVAAEARGAISLNWDITGTLLSSDSVKLCISEGDETVTLPDCAGQFNTTLADEDRAYTYSGSQTEHGSTYYVTLAVCNEVGCSNPGLGNATADKRVDGAYTVDTLTVEVGADGTSWDLTWVVSGDTSDVAMWHVCKGTDNFDAANMPMDCGTGVGVDVNTMNIAMPAAIQNGKTHYFTVVGMDAKGNMDASASLNEAQDTRTADTSNDDDGNNVIDDGGDDAAGGVPTWTWGLIGGVVIVAFVAGAFILSQGDGEGGEGKDWDY